MRFPVPPGDIQDGQVGHRALVLLAFHVQAHPRAARGGGPRQRLSGGMVHIGGRNTRRAPRPAGRTGQQAAARPGIGNQESHGAPFDGQVVFAPAVHMAGREGIFMLDQDDPAAHGIAGAVEVLRAAFPEVQQLAFQAARRRRSRPQQRAARQGLRIAGQGQAGGPGAPAVVRHL